MLIRIFRTGYFIKIFMFLIISLLLWFPVFLNPPSLVTESTLGIGYEVILSKLFLSARLATFIAFALLLIQAMVFNALLANNPFFSKSVFLPALVYVILMSHHPLQLTLHPALIANFFLIFSLKNLYNTYDKKEALREAFNTSFWVSVASLFYLPAIFMMLLVWWAFLIFRINTWREWLISVIGAATPYLLLLTGCYLTDTIDFLKAFYPGNLSWVWAELSITQHDYIFWPAFLILLLVAYYKFSVERNDKIISVRKGFAVVNAYMVLSALTLLIAGPDLHQHAYLLFPASAAIISYYFIETRKRILAEILFLLLLLAIGVAKFI